MPNDPEQLLFEGNLAAVELPDSTNARKLLLDVDRFSELGDPNGAIDAVIERFEQWLVNGAWEACHEVLADADVAKLDPTISLAILSMTLVEKNRLSASRQSFYRRVRRRLVAEYGEAEANNNLQGLE